MKGSISCLIVPPEETLPIETQPGQQSSVLKRKSVPEQAKTYASAFSLVSKHFTVAKRARFGRTSRLESFLTGLSSNNTIPIAK
jgi:hypothetical protein